MGPMNNYHLRATTPFEDAGERVSRFGRNLIQPLKYWANEARIYKRGVIEGIVRAEEVELPKKKRPKKKGRKRINKLDDIDEDSETESVMADEWEDEVGVIAGMVANWDPETQMGNPEDLIREGESILFLYGMNFSRLTTTDLGFASSSIVTRPVTGSNTDFSYAKILTLPFFGSGVVELPPNGFKRAKNSRKMQQCFFVHEGKVMVEVGAASVGETTQFAISKGGVWVVPRGKFAQSSLIYNLVAGGTSFRFDLLEIWIASRTDIKPAACSKLTRQQMAVTHRFRHRLTSQSGVCATSRRIKDVVVQTPARKGVCRRTWHHGPRRSPLAGLRQVSARILCKALHVVEPNCLSSTRHDVCVTLQRMQWRDIYPDSGTTADCDHCAFMLCFGSY